MESPAPLNESSDCQVLDIQCILTDKHDEHGNQLFYVKFNKRSYHKCEWVSAKEMEACKDYNQLMLQYKQRTQGLPPNDCFNQRYLQPEKIIGSRFDDNGDTVYLVKWCDLPAEEATWETAQDVGDEQMVKEFSERNRVPECGNGRQEVHDWVPILKSDIITAKNGASARNTQVEGANFLMGKWMAGTSAILTDEEDGDDIIEIVLFLQQLMARGDVSGPVMVVAPLDSLGRWENEFMKWTDMSFLSFCGTTGKRELMKKYEVFYPKTETPKFQVLGTTNEFAVKELQFFKRIEWQCIIVDEGERRNNRVRIVSELEKMSCRFHILIAKGVASCSVSDLWLILRFVDKKRAEALKKFHKQHKITNEQEISAQLHHILKSMTWKRPLEEDNLNEVVVECGITELQRESFETVYGSGKQEHKLSNLKKCALDLMKVCNHPCLLDNDEKRVIESDDFVNNSGKMIFLDKFLAKLNTDNKKVLICCQSDEISNLLQKYLTFRNLRFLTIDGTVRGAERDTAVTNFNSENDAFLVLLLSLQALGQPVNLTGVTTVVFYDSGFAPANDAHLINKCVKNSTIYRLITSESFESIVFDRFSSVRVQKNDILSNQDKLGRMIQFGHYSFQQIDRRNNELLLQRSVECTLACIPTKPSPLQVQTHHVQTPIPPASSSSTENSEDDDDTSEEEEVSEEFEWSREKLRTLMQLLLKFGWGKWNPIRKEGNFDVSAKELKSVCRLLLKKLLDSTSEQFPISKMLYAEDNSNKEWEDNFAKTNKRMFDPSLSQHVNWKLGIIETLYFINQTVLTCPNPPKGIVLPRLQDQQDQPSWWTDEDDKRLVYGVYKYGYVFKHSLLSNHTEIEFTNSSERPKDTFLTARTKAIVTGLNECYARYKEVTGDNAPFSHKVLLKALSAWTKKEQRAILSHISLCGLCEMKKMYKAIGLKDKSLKKFTEFVNWLLTIVKALEAKRSQRQDDLPEKITVKQAQKIQSRIRLLKLVKELENVDGSPEEQFTIKHVQEHGLRDLCRHPEITKRFGTENTEKEVIQFLQEKTNSDDGVETSTPQGPTLEPRSGEGSELPLKIGNNLIISKIGQCLPDRPRFHSERYIYPVGFESMRCFTSIINPREKVWYRSSIHDNGGEDPLFRVEIPNTSHVFEGNAPSKPWSDVMREVEAAKKRHHLPLNKTTAVSGPEYFGLSAPQVREMMAKLPGAEQCTRFVVKPSDRSLLHPPAVKARRISSGPIVYEHTKSGTAEEEAHPAVVGSSPSPFATPQPFFKASMPLSEVKELKFDFRKLMEMGDGAIELEEDKRADQTYKIDGSWLYRICPDKYLYPPYQNDPLAYVLISQHMDEFSDD